MNLRPYALLDRKVLRRESRASNSYIIKGTAFDQGNMPTIEASTVAAKYWELYTARKVLRTTLT